MLVIIAPEINCVEYIFSKCKYKKCEFNNLEVYECQYCEHEFVILITGYGKVNIGSSIAFLINHYKCVKLVQIGTAGSINGCSNIYDAAIAQSVLQFDVDFTSLGYSKFTLPKEQIGVFNTDKEMIYQLKKACEINDVNYNVGIIGTSDAFLANTNIANCLNREYGISAVDSECGSVGEISFNNRIPFAGIKIIADYANNNAARQYALYSNEAILISQKIILTFIKNNN